MHDSRTNHRVSPDIPSLPIKGTPFEHQLTGIRHACDLFGIGSGEQKSTGIAYLMEMGCVKTFVAIAVTGIMSVRKLISCVLVVAPLSVLPCGKVNSVSSPTSPMR